MAALCSKNDKKGGAILNLNMIKNQFRFKFYEKKAIIVDYKWTITLREMT